MGKERIIINPEIMAGQPVVKGTRIPIALVLKRFAEELDTEALFAAYPRLTQEDLQACLGYAATIVAGKDVFSFIDQGE